MNLPPKSGLLLLSEPFMQDNNFKRSVILLCEHNKDGSFGLILNKKTEYKIGEFVPEFDLLDAPVFFGGPVQPNTLHFVHIYGDFLIHSMPINEDVFWGGDFEQLKELVAQGLIDPDGIRFFMGYAGWTNEQLQDEVDGNDWIVAQPTYEYIFHDKHNTIWQEIMIDLGGKYTEMAYYPESPLLN